MLILPLQPWVLQLAPDLQGKGTYPLRQANHHTASFGAVLIPQVGRQPLYREDQPARRVLLQRTCAPLARDDGGGRPNAHRQRRLNNPCDLEPPPQHILPPKQGSPPNSPTGVDCQPTNNSAAATANNNDKSHTPRVRISKTPDTIVAETAPAGPICTSVYPAVYISKQQPNIQLFNF